MLLALELLVLYAGAPLAIRAGWIPRFPIPLLLVGSAACTWLLYGDPTFGRVQLWNASGAWAYARPMIEAFAVLGASLTGVVAWRAPQTLFEMVRNRPRLWLLVMIAYPVLSVYPQEIVYRAFFFHRYAALLPNTACMVVASAAFFALGHVFFLRPWIAMSLTFAGGLLFSYHYAISRSLLLASVEHALFGQLVFTIGLGRFFYSRAGRTPIV